MSIAHLSDASLYNMINLKHNDPHEHEGELLHIHPEFILKHTGKFKEIHYHSGSLKTGREMSKNQHTMVFGATTSVFSAKYTCCNGDASDIGCQVKYKWSCCHAKTQDSVGCKIMCNICFKNPEHIGCKKIYTCCGDTKDFEDCKKKLINTLNDKYMAYIDKTQITYNELVKNHETVIDQMKTCHNNDMNTLRESMDQEITKLKAEINNKTQEISKLNEQIRDHSIHNELNSDLNNKYESVLSDNEQLKSQLKDKDVQIQKLQHQLKFNHSQTNIDYEKIKLLRKWENKYDTLHEENKKLKELLETMKIEYENKITKLTKKQKKNEYNADVKSTLIKKYAAQNSELKTSNKNMLDELNESKNTLIQKDDDMYKLRKKHKNEYEKLLLKCYQIKKKCKYYKQKNINYKKIVNTLNDILYQKLLYNKTDINKFDPLWNKFNIFGT